MDRNTVDKNTVDVDTVDKNTVHKNTVEQKHIGKKQTIIQWTKKDRNKVQTWSIGHKLQGLSQFC